MQKRSYSFLFAAKRGLYLFSLFLLAALSLFIYIRSLTDFTSIPRLPDLIGELPLSALMLFGSLTLIFILLTLHRLLSGLSLKAHRLILLGCAAAAVCLQLWLLFSLRPVLRYDHLKVFDEALGLLRTGEISLTAHDGYFGYYPFNIPITLLHAGLLRIFTLLGIGEGNLMLVLQCFYALAIDSAVAASYFIVKKLRGERPALLVLLICLLHPIFYVCASGCYTTTLMIPLLMWNLFLIVFLLTAKRPRTKLLLAFLLGAALVFGVKIRATILITAIAFAGYLIVRDKNKDTCFPDFKQTALLAVSLSAGALLCFGGFFFAEKRFVRGDYSETQLPPTYYIMFAANPDTRGYYSESDFDTFRTYETLEEKKQKALETLEERLERLGPSGTAQLAGRKLERTWTDGTEDYADFLATSRDYGALYDFIAGSRADYFALYCHTYHLAMTGLLLICLLSFLKRKRCDTPYYILLLNLLGGMLFHILWESYYVYSLSFLPLMLIAASDGISCLSEQKVFARRLIPLGFAALGAFPVCLLLFPYAKDLAKRPENVRINAVVQDMYDGNDMLALLKDEAVTQSFCTGKPFNHVAVRVLNDNVKENASFYVMQLIDENGTEIANKTFSGLDVSNKDYCYLSFPTVAPEGKKNFTIRLLALAADEENHLTFPYYHTGNYDIYPEGSMSGLNSSEKSDLNFLVFHFPKDES